GDAWAGLLASAAAAVYFFVPWFWPLRRDLRLSQEYLADAAAAERATRVEDYAEFLVNLSGPRAAPVGATGVRGSSSDLYRRVTMLLNTSSPPRRRAPRWVVAAGGGLLGLAVAVAGVGFSSAQPPADAPKPAPKPDDKAPAKGDEPKAKDNPQQ